MRSQRRGNLTAWRWNMALKFVGIFTPRIFQVFSCVTPLAILIHFPSFCWNFSYPKFTYYAMKRIQKTRSGLTAINWYNKTSSFMKNTIIFSFNSINSYLLLLFWVMILFIWNSLREQDLFSILLLLVKQISTRATHVISSIKS